MLVINKLICKLVNDHIAHRYVCVIQTLINQAIKDKLMTECLIAFMTTTEYAKRSIEVTAGHTFAEQKQ